MTLRKVYMLPKPSNAARDTSNSINQIVLRLAKVLPSFGWEITENEAEADIVAVHAGQGSGVVYCDVAHCHGLYPTGEYESPRWHWSANRAVINNLLMAREVTVPSTWVKDILAHEMLLESTVTPWAIDPTEWQVSGHQGYTLWNKTRVGPVCDVVPLNLLASALPTSRFMSTFGENSLGNIHLTGVVPFDRMQTMVQGCSIYLATTKETFGIGNLEAMATGSPILGYNWGALPDYVEHGVHGFLAEPGDTDSLIDGWHYCMTHREILGENARQAAIKYTWDSTAKQFAEIYDKAYTSKLAATSFQTDPKVSVVVPVYNYAQYVAQALHTVLNQETPFPFEVIVVNDGSIDNSAEVIQEVLDQYSHISSTLIDRKENKGVAYTRNQGIAAAKAEYIMCLDADDLLGSPKVLELLAHFLDVTPDTGMAYTGLATFNESAGGVMSPSGWPGKCDALQHFKGHNQVPTCNMFRKKLWKRAGGYKWYATPAEDAELWGRILLLGYNASKVTNEPWFHYRVHSGSLSHEQRIGKPPVDWLMFHSWAKTQKFPAAFVGKAHDLSWPVHNYDKPRISVIIPVGPGHADYLLRALDSVYGQTNTNWECIVVNDTGAPLEVYPWVKVINPEGSKRYGSAAITRNAGIRGSIAPYVAFLDADDYYDPYFLAETYGYHIRTGKYIYTDWVSLTKQDTVEVGNAAEYTYEAVFNGPILHTVNILVPREWLVAVGMFDEDLDTWEDVELIMALAAAQYCGARLAQPLVYYDYKAGTRREYGGTIDQTLKKYLWNKYSQYMGEAAKQMCCDKVIAEQLPAEEMLKLASKEDMVRVRYIGAKGKLTLVILGQSYGRRQYGDVFYVWKQHYTAFQRWFELVPDIPEPGFETQLPPIPTSGS